MSLETAKHVIIGSAGHVDHGKTTLIRAMTGINTDRLKEEQERGLTIDLGFAFLKLPSGIEAGIVDVPGHERFLKNMLAGASGVDIALLVVAADEGVMPQTKEHLEILQILETRQGVVALTKCDTVDEEWLGIVEDDVRSALIDTFLAGARIIRVSGVTGKGLGELVYELDRLAAICEPRPVEGPSRLPIDRVFTMTGFGTVATGTLVSGRMRLNDSVVVLPQGIQSRVRQIQVHGKKQETAVSGTRVAVNLVGVEVSDLTRGDVIASPGSLQATTMPDAWVKLLADAAKPLRSRSRIRLHIGAGEAIGRCVVLGGTEILPGAEGFAQLRLETAVAAARRDRFVLRSYSPMRVLGGGVILDPLGERHKSADKAVVERLQRKLSGEASDIVQDILAIHETGLTPEDAAAKTGLAANDVAAALKELTTSGLVFQFGSRFLYKGAYENLAAKATAALGAYHEANPMRAGMPKEELRRSLGPGVEIKTFQSVLAKMSDEASLVMSEAIVRLPDHSPTLTAAQAKLERAIEAEYRDAGANPPLISEAEAKYGEESSGIIALLVERRDLVRIAPDLLFHREAIERSESILKDYLREHGRITVGQFRDAIGSSRKYVVPLLEYFDSKKLTRRIGDQRALFK